MTDNDSRMLMDAILDYMGWVKSVEDHRGNPSHLRYTAILTDFLIYVIHKGIVWDKVFTFDTVEAFRDYSGYKGASSAIRALSDYLFTQGRIDKPLQVKKPPPPLPDVYGEYLLYHSQGLNSSPPHLRRIRRVLSPFCGYLEKRGIALSRLKIEHCDAFMATFKVSDYSRRLYHYCLRGFLKYLYHEKKIIKRDLAPLLVGPPQFAQRKLPKFLRPKQEFQG